MRNVIAIIVILCLAIVALHRWNEPSSATLQNAGDREEIVFWHFWGGRDLDVVRDVVARFNRSQDRFVVREVAMPGNNFQAKLFLSIAGGSPPDLVNQDDPILADWTAAGLIEPLDAVASTQEVAEAANALLPAANRLSAIDGRMMALCNGLDIRAMYCNVTALKDAGQPIPGTLAEFERVVESLTPVGNVRNRDFFAFLPNHRHAWLWTAAFGGNLADANRFNDPRMIEALAWLQSFSKRYGASNVTAFQQSDQSLPGKAFPLLPLSKTDSIGRYVFLVDGQWRVRDLESFAKGRAESGARPIEFAVLPLPSAQNLPDAGWVNGNFFVVPRGARNKRGAWEFMKFWVGIGRPEEAAKTCADGGWIPVTRQVIEHPDYKAYLQAHPLMRPFVALAGSERQQPLPMVPAADQMKRLLDQTAYRLLANPDLDVATELQGVDTQVRSWAKGKRPTGAER
ncbi:MAG: extracellular solute-binding protein [Pirellulaceae bacterium]